MGDMAKQLGTSTPFLSAVENGKKNVPAEWVPKLVSLYGLNEDETRELTKAVEESKLQCKIILGNAGVNQRRAAMQFARSFEEMDDETALKIMAILGKKEELD